MDSLLLLNPSEWNIIGQGASGLVLVSNNHTVTKIAAKLIQVGKNEQSDEKIKEELKALIELRHPNIVYFYRMIRADFHGRIFHMLEMEYCERDCLRKVMNDPTIIYNISTVFGWMEMLFSALKKLKEKRMVHRDLKPENVLVTKDFILKVADFGLVRDLTRGDTVSTVGTERYMSPELLLVPNGQKPEVTYQSDIYAVGLICWEIVERSQVYREYFESTSRHFLWEMESRQLKLKPPCCDDPLKSIIMGSIEINLWEKQTDSFFEKRKLSFDLPL